jgi:2-haloacid dehalogenase
MLFHSDLAKAYKPDPKVYLRAINALKLQPADCAMAAAHVYDLEAAKQV